MARLEKENKEGLKEETHIIQDLEQGGEDIDDEDNVED
jgi:hypothetical protein